MVTPEVVTPAEPTELIVGAVVSPAGGGGGGGALPVPGIRTTKTSRLDVEPQLLVNTANRPSRLIVARGVSQYSR
jgi:hypothetical protein